MPTIHHRNGSLLVEVAATPMARQIGLKGRSGLAPDRGMLFLFDTEGFHPFTMDSVGFPLDLLCFSASGRLLGVVPLPANARGPFCGPVPYHHAVETAAGWALAHGVAVGDHFSYDSNPWAFRI